MKASMEVELWRPGLQNFGLGTPAEGRVNSDCVPLRRNPSANTILTPDNIGFRRSDSNPNTSIMGSPLEGCVASLRNSMQLLDSSINILAEGVNDYPRLAKVLHTTRHFELISETDLHTAQSALLSEIKPEVENLLKRVENYLDKLERREQSLIAKCDLNDGRLGRDSTGAAGSRPNSSAAQRRSSSKAMSAQQELRYKQLRQKKDRLTYAVETLEMQAKQRERQLRMSMAAPQQFYDD
ncbi:DASH complex subunit spc19 [Pleosporales sp. CAS-2024a]